MGSTMSGKSLIIHDLPIYKFRCGEIAVLTALKAYANILSYKELERSSKQPWFNMYSQIYLNIMRTW